MGQDTSRFAGLEAGRGRAALLGAATVVVAVLAVALTATGVTDGEVAATLLFLPVFAAGLLVGRSVGYVAAALATAVYVALRRDDLSSAGAASAGVLTLTRAGAYVVAAHVGALARSLTAPSPAGSPPGPRPARAREGAVARPAVRDDWQQVWEPTDDRHRAPQPEPVLAGVGSSLSGGYESGPAWPGDEGGNGVYSTTMSGAWPPDPPDTPWSDQGGQDPSRGHAGPEDETPWGDDRWPAGGDPVGGSGWPAGGRGGGGRGAPPVDESWDAVQQSWREQHGLPPEDAGGTHDQRGWDDRGAGGDRAGWPSPNGAAPTDAWPAGGGAPTDAWEQQRQGGAQDAWGAAGTDAWGGQGGGAQADQWGQAGARDAWGRPAEQAPREGAWPVPLPDDPWGDRAPTGGTWPEATAADGEWGAAPGPPEQSREDLDAWPQVGGDPGAGWPAGGDAHGGAPGSDASGWPYVAPSGQAGWRAAGADTGGWAPEAAPTEAHDGGWGAPEARSTGSHDDLWGAPEARSTGSHDDLWGAPEAPPRRSTGEWPVAGGAVPPGVDVEGEPGGWGALAGDAWPETTGRTDTGWDRHDGGPQTEQWEPGWSPGAPGNGAAPTLEGAGLAGRAGHAGHGPGGGQPAPLPAVDPETGLWTAQFLRDRLNAERARSRRSGHPFSLVLVQVPDGPLAQLPYRRQLTLLRELGYQFVAGGVVDHLVHVPDQNQHWFAVILPDTDRSGAHVLERRLRLGIGGYLSSRGLRLRDLESASLTAPDDDPAMGAIWDALIGSTEGT